MKSEISFDLPKGFLNILKELDSAGFECALVGGTVRDQLLGRPCKNDFDVEVRGDFELLKEKLPNGVEELKYKVLKYRGEGFEAEFSLPRIEEFHKSYSFSHSNFTAIHDESLSYKKASKRRDLTLNSIYAVFDKEKFFIKDPLDGVEHIKQKRLVPCSKNFPKDPVRFLRAVRFSILFDFELSEEIKLPGRVVDTAYFLKEANKSGRPLMFLQKILELHHEPYATEVKSMISFGYSLESFSEIQRDLQRAVSRH